MLMCLRHDAHRLSAALTTSIPANLSCLANGTLPARRTLQHVSDSVMIERGPAAGAAARLGPVGKEFLLHGLQIPAALAFAANGC
jgi:hypothetical protein